jgi:hypothetical protein
LTVSANQQGGKHLKDFEAQKATTNLNQEEGAVLQKQQFPQTSVQDFTFWQQETPIANKI